MGSNKTTSGKCTECGKKANLRNYRNKALCPTCGSVRGVVYCHPAMVIKYLKEFGTFPGADGGDVREANSTIKDLRDRLDIATRALFDAEEDLKIEAAKNGLLRSANVALEQADGNGSGSGPDVSHLAWKWLEGMAAGDISGIEIEDLRELRDTGKKQMERQ